MNHEELIDETHPDYLEARALIEHHGVEPGPQGHTSEQLTDASWARGWSWKLNEDMPDRRQAGDYAELWKDYGPGRGRHSVPCWGSSPVAALTLALAAAIEHDEWRKING